MNKSIFYPATEGDPVHHVIYRALAVFANFEFHVRVC